MSEDEALQLKVLVPQFSDQLLMILIKQIGLSNPLGLDSAEDRKLAYDFFEIILAEAKSRRLVN